MDKLKFKGTPAPWRWELNEKAKSVSICGGKPMFDLTVMDFVRWGMGGAAPRFNKEKRPGLNLMERCEQFGEVVKGREHHAHWFKDINHPDALLMVKAPELLQFIIDTYQSLNEENKKKAKELIESLTEVK